MKFGAALLMHYVSVLGPNSPATIACTKPCTAAIMQQKTTVLSGEKISCILVRAACILTSAASLSQQPWTKRCI